MLIISLFAGMVEGRQCVNGKSLSLLDCSHWFFSAYSALMLNERHELPSYQIAFAETME